jgi:phage tail-like protein
MKWRWWNVKRNEIAQLLPNVFRRTAHPGSPLFALLDAMEALHAPSEAVLARLHTYFDPRQTPDEFVPMLAHWVDLEWLFDLSALDTSVSSDSAAPISTGLGRLRELIALAAYLYKWRGTAQGMKTFLEVATGLKGFEIEEQVRGEDGSIQPFHLRLYAPEVARSHQVLIERIIESEKPAYVTYELSFQPINT